MALLSGGFPNPCLRLTTLCGSQAPNLPGTVALTVRVVGFTLQLYEMSAAAAAAARLLEVKLGLSLQLETGATGLALSAGLTGIPYRSNPSPQNEHTANCVDWSPPGVSLCSFIERVVDSMLNTPVRFPYEW